MFKDKRATFKPFLCLRSDCVYHQGWKINNAYEKRKLALSDNNEIVKKLGRAGAARWFDAGRSPIPICSLHWITTDWDGQCLEYTKKE